MGETRQNVAYAAYTRLAKASSIHLYWKSSDLRRP